ncbi:hypothetical protein ACFQ3Z_29430 [Streptomyces nogalater]
MRSTRGRSAGIFRSEGGPQAASSAKLAASTSQWLVQPDGLTSARASSTDAVELPRLPSP